MTDATMRNGWERLPNGFDVEFRHNIPTRLSDNGKGLTIPESTLIEEITALGGLHIKLADWEPGELPNEHEARLLVSSKQLKEVLQRLALSSAELFVDRFHKPVDKNDIDWDRLEFLNDFRKALNYCGLVWGDVDKSDYLDDYVETMHLETHRLAQRQDTPMVEPEQERG
jgi:hypothetical protein